jgi:hypothetical protein
MKVELSTKNVGLNAKAHTPIREPPLDTFNSRSAKYSPQRQTIANIQVEKRSAANENPKGIQKRVPQSV